MSKAAKPPKELQVESMFCECRETEARRRPLPESRAKPSGPGRGPSGGGGGVGGGRNQPSCCYITLISFTAVRGLKMLIGDFLQVNPDAIWQPRSTIILPQFAFQLLLEARQARKAHLRPGPDRSANSSAPQDGGGCFSFTDQRSGFSLRR